MTRKRVRIRRIKHVGKCIRNMERRRRETFNEAISRVEQDQGVINMSSLREDTNRKISKELIRF